MDPQTWTTRLALDAAAPAFSGGLAHLDKTATKELDRVGFDTTLRDVLRLRVSQLNGCLYCIDMHSKDARAGGETEQRLYALPAWQEAPFFSARERAALALADAMTLRDPALMEPAWEAAAAAYSDDELGALVALATTINAWNAVSVATRAWEPGTYQPS